MENKEQKTNPFLKALKALGHYLKFVFVDFLASFKYNNMKLPAILIAIPGITLGFFLVFHIPTVRNVIASYTRDIEGSSGEYSLAYDEESPNQNLYYKLVMNDLKYNNKSYNLVLRRHFDNPEGTKVAKPKGLTAEYKDEKITFKIDTPEGDGASAITSYNVFIYQEKNGKDYVIKTFKNHVYGTDIKVTDLGQLEYSICVQAVADGFAPSELSDAASLKVDKAGSTYNIDQYSFIEYAGTYIADAEGLDDVLSSYKIDILASGDVKIYANNVQTEAEFSSTIATSFTLTAREVVHILPFNYSGMILFILMLCGILNIFFALSVSGKKNLGSVVKSSIATAGIIVCAILYIVAIVATESAIRSGDLKTNVATVMDSNAILSITFIVLSVVISIAGCVLGFIYHDRNYEKVTY